MQLPWGLGQVRAGFVAADPVATSVGSVRVTALGLALASPWGGLRLLYPWRACLTGPDGRRESLAVRDVTGWALLRLALTGLAMALLCQAVRRRGSDPDG